MKWLDDFVFVVAGEDESAIANELLSKRPKTELYIWGCVVSFVNDDDFVFRI